MYSLKFFFSTFLLIFFFILFVNSSDQLHDYVVVDTFEGEAVNEEVIYPDSPKGSRGFNDLLPWINNLEQAIELSSKENKLIFLLIHNSGCGACHRLKEAFFKKELVDLSSNFIMVNLEGNEEPKDHYFMPDGSYVPRIFFIDSNGHIISNIINKSGNNSYRYYYSRSSQIIDSMKDAITFYNSTNTQPPSHDEL